jgi:hypothetical protein
MPQQQTNLIIVNGNDRKASPKVRNHWIKIYPEARVSSGFGGQNGQPFPSNLMRGATAKN